MSVLSSCVYSPEFCALGFREGLICALVMPQGFFSPGFVLPWGARSGCTSSGHTPQGFYSPELVVPPGEQERHLPAYIFPPGGFFLPCSDWAQGFGGRSHTLLAPAPVFVPGGSPLQVESVFSWSFFVIPLFDQEKTSFSFMEGVL